jgi:hypothetical protein
MLRRFIYLDRDALRQYASMVGGGLATQSTRTESRSGHRTGGIDLKAASGEKGSSTEDAESRTLEDTDEARFDRLVVAASERPEALGWVEVINPDVDLEGIGIGAVVSWQCEVWVPPIVAALSAGGDFANALTLLRQISPAAKALGLPMDGLPPTDQLDAVEGAIKSLDAKTVIVGDDDETEWKVTATVESEWQSGEVDGHAYVVGKVRKVIPTGSWQPLVTLPGLNLLSREERRARAKKGPEQGKEAEYVAGPALVLDLLAVYR